jgi:hypothetical protein
MNKINLCLVIGIIILCSVLTYFFINNTKENFEDSVLETETILSTNHPDIQARDIAQQLAQRFENEETSNDEQSTNEENNFPHSDYVKRTDLETVARVSAREYCPVTPDYNPSDYVKKSEIDFQAQCPRAPDLKDYVLKSTIPPVQKCPSCICPKVKVAAGMCKKCPKVKNNCPKPEPCNYKQCKNVCPKCPAPKPCPKAPERVCPSLVMPKPVVNCPAPSPCPMPSPCPNGDGRCPDKKCPSCKYYGVKEELLNNNDPRLQELLEKLKNKMDLNNSVSPTEFTSILNDINTNHIEIPNLNPESNIESAPSKPSLASNSLELDEPNSYSNINYNVYETPQDKEPTRFEPNPLSNTNLDLGSLNAIGDNNLSNNYCPYNTNLNI